MLYLFVLVTFIFKCSSISKSLFSVSLIEVNAKFNLGMLYLFVLVTFIFKCSSISTSLCFILSSLLLYMLDDELVS